MKPFTVSVAGRAWRAGIVLGLSVALAGELHAAEVAGEVRLSTDGEAVAWAGQQVTMNLDLLTTGFSFSDQHFLLPEVSGGFLMQTDSTTIKLTESRDGETWQVLRYPIVLFPQRRGRLTVPSFEVRFRARAGFGHEPRLFTFRTEPLHLTVKWPPGAEESSLLITTRSFDLRAAWTPAPAGDEPLTVLPGDAVTLRVTQTAVDVSGMVLPGLPVPSVPGMAAYSEAPVVSDRASRGALTGSRTDAVTWVFERPGRYDVPEIRYRWFDPSAAVLKELRVPGRSFVVSESAGTTGHDRLSGLVRSGSVAVLLWLAGGALMVGLGGLSWWWRKVGRGVRSSSRAQSEARLRKAAVAACRRHDPAAAYAALSCWVEGYSGRPAALLDFARAQDAALCEHVEGLQQALISRSAWNGDALAAMLKPTGGDRKSSQSGALRPLNPGKGQSGPCSRGGDH